MKQKSSQKKSFLKYFLGGIIIVILCFYKKQSIKSFITHLISSTEERVHSNTDNPKTSKKEHTEHIQILPSGKIDNKESHDVSNDDLNPTDREGNNDDLKPTGSEEVRLTSAGSQAVFLGKSGETISPVINKKQYDSSYDDENKNIIYTVEKTQYINRILIVKTSNIFMWHFLNFGLLWDHHAYRNNIKENNKIYYSFSTACYVFEVLFRFLSFSYTSKTNRRYGMYWKIHLFDNYNGYHNFNEKCTRGLLGFYVGFYYNYIKTKNFKIGFYYGIGTMIQRFYGLCYRNRVVDYSTQSNKNIKNMQFYCYKSTKDNKKIIKSNTEDVLLPNDIRKRQKENPFGLYEILINPLSYYNADIIVDLSIFNLEHKNGFCLNINWKAGIVNTYLIFQNYYKKKDKKDEKKYTHILGYFIMYNLSISCGFDLNKKR